jgi:uncharacterized protein (DUF1499 family)
VYFIVMKLQISIGLLTSSLAWVPRRDVSTKRIPQNNECDRRTWFKHASSAFAIIAAESVIDPAFAAETIGKDPDCNEAGCLGVWDGLLADCPHSGLFKMGAGCTASQDDTPGIFSEPWDYSEAPNNSLDWQEQMRLLVPAVQLVSARRGDQADIVMQKFRYLRVLFTDGKAGEKSIGEFYFTPNDVTVQFRVGTLGAASSFTSLKNIERCELIRKELRYLKLPVLRNRKRSLFFVESDLDTFGPGSAALGPPAEMKTGELENRQDVDPKLKIDWLQQFPLSSK